MKILQIIQKPQFRGAEIFACQLSTQLVKLGHEVDVIFLFGTESLPFSIIFLHLKADGSKRWWDFKGYKKLAKIIALENYDIVQANAGDTLKYAALSKKLYKWKAKLVFRNANKISDFLDSPIKKILNKWLVKEVDFVASVSTLCMQDFNAVFQFPGNKIAGLPIGVNMNLPDPYKNFEDAGISFNHQHGSVFLHVGSFVPEKNHAGLIRLFKDYKKQNPAAKLLLIGKGKLENDIKTMVATNQLQDEVIFLGARNDVLRIMPLCTALLMPSLIEGLPGVILEAMTCRIPVIAYNVGGIGEVVINESTGFLVNKDNESGFIHCMKQCTQSNNNHIVDAAYQLVKNHYDNHKIATDFLHYYHQII